MTTLAKTCRRCKVDKPASSFSPSLSLKDGLHSYCKTCANAKAKEWQAANREKHLDSKRATRRRNPEDKRTPQQRWNERNPEKLREYTRSWIKKQTAEWKAANREKVRITARHYGLMRRGLSAERYAEILATQNGVCAICGEVNNDGRPLAIDHDHTCPHPKNHSCSKCFRGLLCVHCNTTLHKMETMRDWHLKALAYLERFKEK